MNSEIKKGTVCAIVSALVFGITPVLASLTFQMGSNALTLTFYRNALAVPVLLIILLVRKISLRISLKDFLVLAGISAVFSATTTFILYDAYNYIGVGLSTTLHFLYPVFTVLFGWIFFKRKIDKAKIAALLLATAGVAMATGEGDSFALKGIILAVLSAVTYAAYLLGIEHSAIGKMDSMKSMFYMCIVNAAVVALYDCFAGEIVYGLSPLTMLYTLILAVANSAFAYVLIIVGIRMIGAGTAAIYSMLEPVSGVAAGVIFLSEDLPLMKLASCIVILGAVMIPIIKDRNSGKEADVSEAANGDLSSD